MKFYKTNMSDHDVEPSDAPVSSSHDGQEEEQEEQEEQPQSIQQQIDGKEAELQEAVQARDFTKCVEIDATDLACRLERWGEGLAQTERKPGRA